jgi:hypothetical protein
MGEPRQRPQPDGNKSAAVTDWREAVRLEPKLGDQLNPLIKGS